MRCAAGAAFLLFVGLLPAALAAVMVPFLNYVPFEEASVRSCFTSGAHSRSNEEAVSRRMRRCIQAKSDLRQQRMHVCPCDTCSTGLPFMLLGDNAS